MALKMGEEIQSKTKSDWSENYEENLNVVLSYINDEYLCRWIKDVIHAKYDGLVVWGNDDENILNAITYTVKNSGYKHCIGVSNEVMIEWLKSIKERITSM